MTNRVSEDREVFRVLYWAARWIARDIEDDLREDALREHGINAEPSVIDVAPAQLGIESILLGYAFSEGLIPGHWTVAKANRFVYAASASIAERRWVELVAKDVEDERRRYADRRRKRDLV